VKDERIEQAKKQIGSEMAVIIICGVAISFLIKILVYRMSLQQCITEYLILILSPLYQFIRMHTMKVSIYDKQGDNKTIKNVVMIVVFLVIATMLFFVNSAKEHKQGSFTFLLVFWALFLAFWFIFNKINQQRSLKYEKEFDDETH
jgi:hypothetical protein